MNIINIFKRFNYQKKFKHSILYMVVSFIICNNSVRASEELDMSFIQGGHNLDRSFWDKLNKDIIPGKYLVDVILNGNNLGKQVLDVSLSESRDLCFTDDWLSKKNIYINASFFKNQFDNKRKCYILSENTSTKIKFDVSTQTLFLGIPQAGLKNAPENIEWNYGSSALRVNYNVNANTGKYYTGGFASTALKANLFNWVLNTNALASSGDSGNDISINTFTATRAIQSLNADLSVGQIQSGDSLLGGTGIYGASLTNNNKMKPGNLGYMPIFSGIANSPSRVTLTQGGRVLYSETVPTGPFSITDVSLYTSGDVQMTIQGDDGREEIQNFPLSVIPGQINPKEHEFNVSIGIPDDDSHLDGGIASVSYGYGFNHLTVNSSAIINNDYQGGSIGIVTGLGVFGALSLDSMWSNAKYQSQSSRNGSKYQLTWSKKIEASDTYLRASWAKTPTEDYTELSGFNPKEEARIQDSVSGKVKNEWNVGISQPIKDLFNFSISAWDREYHHNNKSDYGFNGALNTRINDINLSFGMSGSRNTNGNQNWSMTSTVSIPFTLFERRYNSYSSITHSKSGGVGVSSGISGSLNERLNYGVSFGRDSSGSINSTANVSYASDKAYLNTSLNHSSDNGISGSLSVSGSILAVPAAQDFIFNKTTSETVAIVNVKDTANVKVTSGIGRTDKSGNLVVPLGSYDWNSVTIDAGSLPIDMELTDSSQKVFPTEQAVIWMPFDVVKVRRYLLQIRKKDGMFVAAGLWAKDKNNTPLGFVSNNGILMVNSVESLNDISLGEECRISSYKLKETEKLQEIMCD